jgi:hypothetical protein
MALRMAFTLAALTSGTSGSPMDSGVRSSSAKRSVSARNRPSSATIATTYCLPRITKLAMPALSARSSVAASRR